MKLIAQGAIGTINPPAQVGALATGNGGQDLSNFVSGIINLVMAVSAVIFVFMIVYSGFQWITSGGNKDKVASARGRITHAIIGLIIVATAAVIAQIIGSLLGFNIFRVAP